MTYGENYAAMSVEYDTDQQPDDTNCIGIFTTAKEADVAIRQYETLRIETHDALQERWKNAFYALPAKAPIFRYCIIPLRDVTVSIGALEAWLEAEALRKVRGQ